VADVLAMFDDAPPTFSPQPSRDASLPGRHAASPPSRRPSSARRSEAAVIDAFAIACDSAFALFDPSDPAETDHQLRDLGRNATRAVALLAGTSNRRRLTADVFAFARELAELRRARPALVPHLDLALQDSEQLLRTLMDHR
jgi:hypothetical protein